MLLRLLLVLGMALSAFAVSAQDKRFALSAPEELVETGFLKHLLPRFSLKTGIRIELNGNNPAVRIGLDAGSPVFEGAGQTWLMEVDAGPHTDKFIDWLRSEVGQRTIAAFQKDGQPMFAPPSQVEVVAQEVSRDGDAVAGEGLSLRMCGRCHVVNDSNRMNAIGSTPSFAVLRTFPDWEERFEAFYVLRPHGAFTQIEDVTLPFDPARPSPISPLEMTLEDVEAILAYVATIPAADLGAPIQSQ